MRIPIFNTGYAKSFGFAFCAPHNPAFIISLALMAHCGFIFNKLLIPLFLFRHHSFCFVDFTGSKIMLFPNVTSTSRKTVRHFKLTATFFNNFSFPPTPLLMKLAITPIGHAFLKRRTTYPIPFTVANISTTLLLEQIAL
ncbi:hypothetical protein V8G54_029309 [Vigna mungo]|uniref:Uncharacterized protein n=1 Tax=Vigna mungo TaxID=3915 RepID=A0AAQ3RJ25_VIGMU